MNKGLEALERIIGCSTIESHTKKWQQDYLIVEQELKRLEELEEEKQSFDRQLEKKLKALEIIKKYHITSAFFTFNPTYKTYEVNMSFYEDTEIMSEEEYNLAKEVLL